jgi:hypothetical protein
VTTKRRRLTGPQIDKRIALTRRLLEVKKARAIRDGILTREQITLIREDFDRTYEPVKLGVGSLVEWDGDLHRIEAYNDDEVIMSKVSTA